MCHLYHTKCVPAPEGVTNQLKALLSKSSKFFTAVFKDVRLSTPLNEGMPCRCTKERLKNNNKYTYRKLTYKVMDSVSHWKLQV